MMKFNKSVVVAALAASCGAAFGLPGADVIVGDLTGPANWGTVGNTAAFSIGTTSCNLGTENLDWFDGSNRHPVIGQNIYVIREGRIDHLGQSYLKHGFCALQQTLCSSCIPAGGGCAALLGVGCSDPYGASLNGSQGGLGPKRDVNPSTGFFTWPYSQIGQGGNSIFKRIQVSMTDLDFAAQQAGDVVYVGEGLYVAADDAAEGNDVNNASYRLMSLRSNETQFTYQGSTQREKPAIMAWAEHGNGVGQPDAGVSVEMYDLPQDGVVFVGSNAIDNGDGSYTYYYAIENLTSDRGAQALRVPLPSGASASDFYFNDVDYHSGSPYSNTDWSASVEDGEVVFRSPQTFAQNPNTNALRWGTMYTFGFTSDAEPTEGQAAVEYFKTFATLDSEFSVDVTVPAGSPMCNAVDYAAPFGELDIADVVEFLRAFGGQEAPADLAAPFGEWDIADVTSFLQTFGGGCPK